MPNKDQIDFRELTPGKWRVEFDYNEDFVSYLKMRVPAKDRSYDDATKSWEVRGDQYIPALEGVGVQKFTYATKIFWRSGEQVWKNLKTGREEVQKNLF